MDIELLKKSEQLKAVSISHAQTEANLKDVLNRAHLVSEKDKKSMNDQISEYAALYDEERARAHQLRAEIEALKQDIASRTETKTQKRMCRQSYLARGEFIRAGEFIQYGVNKLYIDKDTLQLIFTHKGEAIWADENRHVSFGLDSLGNIQNKYLTGRKKTYNSNECGARLALTPNGDLTLLNDLNGVCWSLMKRNYAGECQHGQCITNKLYIGQSMQIGDSIHYGSNILVLQGDGNLVLKSNERVVWQTGKSDADKLTILQ